MVGGRVARPQPLAAAGAVDGHPVCRRAAHRHQLAPRRRQSATITKTIITSWPPLGRKSESVATQLFLLLLRTLPLPERLLVVIDDSPTKRYGPKVEGADIHHNPTPGPADQKYLYGHIWVTISLALRHPLWGALALPLRAMLYVRQKTIPTIPRKRRWRFRTKLELAARLGGMDRGAGETGGKNPVGGGRWRLHQVPFLSRPSLRAWPSSADFARTPPCAICPRRCGLASDAAAADRASTGRTASAWPNARRQRGWQTIDCTALWQNDHQDLQDLPGDLSARGRRDSRGDRQGRSWLVCLLLHRSAASVVEILEAFADRATIEQDFHDVKEVWGAGQQQVRNIWTNVAVVSSESVDAYAGGTVGMEPQHAVLWRSPRFPLGRSRTPSFPRRSSQSLTATSSSKTNYPRSPPFGRYREKSSRWLDASWHLPCKLINYSESAVSTAACSNFG